MNDEDYLVLTQMVDEYGLQNVMLSLTEIVDENVEQATDEGDLETTGEWKVAEDLLNEAIQNLPNI